MTAFRALRQRLHKIVEAGLAAQGLEYEPGNPDLRVGYYLAMERVDEGEVSQVYAEFTPEFSEALKAIDQGSMSIFVFDAKTGQQVWMANAEGSTDKNALLDKRKKNIEELVALLIAQLPAK